MHRLRFGLCQIQHRMTYTPISRQIYIIIYIYSILISWREKAGLEGLDATASQR
eukprot:COSAG01_NODE_1715_length_9405_cov_5.798517_2_plen_54_part_00